MIMAIQFDERDKAAQAEGYISDITHKACVAQDCMRCVARSHFNKGWREAMDFVEKNRKPIDPVMVRNSQGLH